MEWADAAVWTAVLQADGAADDRQLRNTLLHLHGVQQGFLSIWTDGHQAFPKAESFSDLPSVRQWAQPYYTNAIRFLETADETSLGKELRVPWVEGLERRLGKSVENPTLAETAFQVASHSTYHRGQVNRSLRQLGGTPPLVDYIAWVWFGRPAAEWNLSSDSTLR